MPCIRASCQGLLVPLQGNNTAGPNVWVGKSARSRLRSENPPITRVIVFFNNQDLYTIVVLLQENGSDEMMLWEGR